MVPTRELALQTYEVVKQVSSATCWVVPGLLTGGEKKKSEKNRLRKGLSVLVATPGRLLDHLNTTNSFNVQNLHWLVFDEADRLLDLGFEKSITNICDILRSRIQQGVKPLQTVLLSATLTESIQKLAGKLSMRDPVYVGVAEDSEKSKDSQTSDDFQIPKLLHQHYVIVPCKQRLVTLAAFLRWKAFSMYWHIML